MNDKYLVRGIRKDNKQYIEGYYVKIGETAYIFTGKVITHHHLNDYGLPCCGLEKFPIIPESVEII